jgi:hypothetical protein
MLSKIEIEIMASLGKHRVAREDLNTATELFNSLRTNCPYYFNNSAFGYDGPYCRHKNSERKCMAIFCPLDPLTKKKTTESHPGVSWYTEQ